MYPLNMKSAAGGFAVANDKAEHRSLTSHGYEPALAEATPKGKGAAADTGDAAADDSAADDLAALRAEGKAAGIRGANLMGAEKLRAALGK